MSVLLWIIFVLFLASFILLAWISIMDSIAILKEKPNKKDE